MKVETAITRPGVVRVKFTSGSAARSPCGCPCTRDGRWEVQLLDRVQVGRGCSAVQDYGHTESMRFVQSHK